MADHRTTPSRLGSTDWAAKQFLRILERDEREKRQRAQLQLAKSRTRRGPLEGRPTSITHEKLPDPLDTGPETARFPISRPRTSLPGTPPKEPRQGPPSNTEPYTRGRPAGLLDLMGAGLSGEQGELEDYGAVRAATSEAVASQLPGREHGPADAYRHIIWAAELARRFGERRARELLNLHEVHGQRTNQRPDEMAMDDSNNEIGIQIGIGARDFRDVIRGSRKVIAESVGDGGGQWKTTYDPASTMAPHGATWLDESRWNRNPQVPMPMANVASRAPRPMTRELSNSETNWYSNPGRPNGPDWVSGYVPERYKYLLGSTSNRTGTNDPNILRAISLYRSYINRPWLVGLGEQY